jgi:peptidoglycan/xylan/chitin deacetylase (PgdA/CDA1 family)
LAERLVSVIVPAYNAEDTLAETLQSIESQTFGNWEALVVDDSSTDLTRSIAQGFAERDARFRVLEGPGGSAGGARNAGLAEARGEWLLFVDADDWIEERHLQRMLAALADRPGAVAAYCGSERVRPDGTHMPNTTDESLACRPFQTLKRSCHVAIHAVLVNKRVVEDLGGFDTSLNTCEDWDLWQRVARQGLPWVHVDEVLSYYRVRADSKSQDFDQLMIDAESVVRRGFSPSTNMAHLQIEGEHTEDEYDRLEADRAVGEVVLWFATLAKLAGKSTKLHVDRLARLPASTPPDAVAMASTMLHAAASALFVLPRDLAACWPSYGLALTGLIEDVGAAQNDPVLARRLRYALDRAILEQDDTLGTSRNLGLTQGRCLKLPPFSRIRPSAGIDRLHLRIVYGPWRGHHVDVGLLGSLGRRRQLAILLDYYADGRVQLRAPGTWPRPAVRITLGVFRTIGRALHRRGVLPIITGSRSHTGVLVELQRNDAAAAPTLPKTAPPQIGANWKRAYASGRGSNIWDALYEDEDPWNYGSAYEQEKYDRTIELLPKSGIERALELACAEGRFTRLLAPHVGNLIATDISQVAVERAQNRCREFGNIEFSRLDLISDELPGELDLIVCSEVLYFLGDIAILREAAKRMAAKLKPGGSVLSAHSFVVSDDRERTGFDWGTSFGGETIAAVFAETEGLVLEHSILTDLYRIDRFRKVDNMGKLEPVVDSRVIESRIEHEVARNVIWGATITTRAEARNEIRTKVPVLMYHRVAHDGPEELKRYRVAPDVFREQMRWLRRHGFHAVTSGELAWFIERRHPIVGRPVLLSFDDGFQDFADTAWPIIRQSDFRAEVFVVADLVGGVSEWDASCGGAFPLMDAATIAKLHTEGVVFGSHLASHRAADGLSTLELAQELLRSRSALQGWTGIAPASLAPPYGATDQRLQKLAAECGYSTCFGTRPGLVGFGADLMNLPRFEVRGDRPLGCFTNMMENLLKGSTD